MLVMFACGGTAGHIYPALSMAELLKAEYKDAEIVFVGTPGGMENRLIAKEGYPILQIKVRGLARRLTFSNLKAAAQCIAAIHTCRTYMKKKRPDLVIGTGGYVSFPVIRAAASLQIPCAIHESNALPGLAVKMAAHSADRVWLGRRECLERMKHRENCAYTGTPLRKGFLLGNKPQIRQKMGLPADAFFVLSFGGSLGAARLNCAIYELWEEMTDPHIHFLHISGGDRNFPGLHKVDARHRVLAYTDDMPALMQAADLVICRAGALTVTELTACGKAAILIPSPNVTDNHQFYNAEGLCRAGAALMLTEEQLTGKQLGVMLDDLYRHPQKRLQMEKNARAAGKPDAAPTLLSEMRGLLSHDRSPRNSILP